MNCPDKIVFVGLTDYTNAPTRIRSYNFARMLTGCGYDARVFSFQEELAPPEIKRQEMTAMLHISEDLKEDLVERAIPLLEAMGPALFIIQKAHYHAAAVVEVCKRRGWPYALDYDDDDRGRASLFKDPQTCARWFGAVGQLDVPERLASGASFCLASSVALQEVLSAWNPRVHLIETVADTERFAYVDRAGRDTRRMVWLGQVWGKRIMDCLDVACRAARRLHREGMEFSLHIVGRGMEKELARHLEMNFPGLPFHFDGWAEPDDVPGLLEDMDIGLVPLAPVSLDYEWMRAKSPTKMFEYMATGLPVVATRLGEAARIGKDGESLMLASTESEFADRVRALLVNRSLRLAMGGKARALVEERYSLDSIAGKFEPILRDAGLFPLPAFNRRACQRPQTAG